MEHSQLKITMNFMLCMAVNEFNIPLACNRHTLLAIYHSLFANYNLYSDNSDMQNVKKHLPHWQCLSFSDCQCLSCSV